ncbi:hypothetical protein F5I97DRAFT_1926040 [Phlebopus sp. FC_14]|nr:hypothetical protein F5I97DRAFT_1926040 [Phlebopus sp. FC_14]
MTSQSILISCQWDWCRLTFSTVDDLQLHVKHVHVWPMKPMRKSQIALLRRIDAMDASLHGSQNIASSDSCRGQYLILVSLGSKTVALGNAEPVASLDSLVVGRGQLPTPSLDRMQSSRTQREAFRNFRYLSSPAEMASVRNLPASPNLDSLIALRESQSLPAAVERPGQTHNHKANQPFNLFQERSPNVFFSHSQSSTSSRDAVEQQPTQEDEFDGQLMGPSHSLSRVIDEKDLTGNGFTDTELQWPASDDEVDGLPPLPKDVHDSDSPPIPNQSLGSSSIVAGKRFHSGSLDFSSGRGNASIASIPNVSTSIVGSQESHELTFALQTQAPYSSQSVDSSQSQ